MKKTTTPKSKTLAEEMNRLAEALHAQDDFFAGDLEDACNEDAKLALENINSKTMREKLKFLLAHGFTIERLRKLIEEAKE